MKKRFLLPAIAVLALGGIYAFGSNIGTTCVPGNADYEAGTGICSAKNKAADLAEAKADAERLAEQKKFQAQQAEQRLAEERAKKAAAAAEAKFRAEGWSDTDRAGVYWRWCSQDCDSSKAIAGRYVIAEVWCRDTACGDIYGRVNLMNKQGTVIGWTNDTAYGDVGQKVLLTFDSYQDFDTVRLTELNIRG